MNLLNMNMKELLALNPDDVTHVLSTEEIVHIAKTLNAFWSYDYQAAKNGRPGKHARLKSELHSDGFFMSRILFQYKNIQTIIARQMAYHFFELKVPKPDRVVGIPDGATGIGEEIAGIMGVGVAKMKKDDGRIVFSGGIEDGETLLLVEDFCTMGTGIVEAVFDIKACRSKVIILPYELVTLNRGGLKRIKVPGFGDLRVVAAATHKINNWEPDNCKLCREFGSVAIKPKVSDENWEDITTSQLV